MQVIEGRSGVVEDDPRVIVGSRKFGHEGRQSNAAMFALAKDRARLGIRLVDEADAKQGNAVLAALLAQLYREPRYLEMVDLLCEASP
jgi:hypothetical protein